MEPLDTKYNMSEGKVHLVLTDQVLFKRKKLLRVFNLCYVKLIFKNGDLKYVTRLTFNVFERF